MNSVFRVEQFGDVLIIGGGNILSGYRQFILN